MTEPAIPRSSLLVVFVLLLSLAPLTTTAADVRTAKLCYSTDVPDPPSDCALYLGDLAGKLVKKGPKRLDRGLPAVDDRIATFLNTYCKPFRTDMPPSKGHDCQVHYSTTGKHPVIPLNVRDSYDRLIWDLGSPTCLGWIHEESAEVFEPARRLEGSSDGCPLSGTVYAFIRVGIAVHLKLGVAGISDIAKFPCVGGAGDLKATPAYLLSPEKQHVSFYENMYKTAFRAHEGYDQLRLLGRQLGNTPLGEEVFNAFHQASAPYCQHRKISAATTWGQLATQLLGDCKTANALPTDVIRVFNKRPEVKQLTGVKFDVIVVVK